MQTARREKKLDDAAEKGQGRHEFLTAFFDTELKDIVQQHVHEESLEIKQRTEAEMASFDRMVWLEGGSQNPANVEAARQRCKECVRQGKKFYKKDKWSKRVIWAMVVEKFGKTKKEKWAVIKTGTVAAVPKAGAAVPKAGDPGVPPRPPAEPPKPRTKTAVEESTAKATATKAEYDKVVRKADTIMESMQTDVAYAKEKRAYKELLETAQKAVKRRLGKIPSTRHGS